MDVSIVIPNYNGAELLKNNLPSVRKAAEYFTQKTQKTIEIIIVDDGSTDDSVAELRRLDKSFIGTDIPLRLQLQSKNRGFSSTVNVGVKHAEGEIVVLLNTDVQPEKEFLLPLVPHFHNPNVFAVACLDKSKEEGTVRQRGRGEGSWQRGFLVHHTGNLGKPYTLWASGGSSAFRRSLWEELGGMDEAFDPFYWEDIDLSYRAWKAGYMVLFEKDSMVLHEHEKGVIKTGTSRHAIIKIAYRNQFYFVWKNASDASLLYLHVLWLPYHILSALLRGDTAFLSGLSAALSHLPQILRKRKTVQKQHQRSDAEVMSITLREVVEHG